MKNESDSTTDTKEVVDRGEPIGLMEPLLIGETSQHRAELVDLALELAQRSAGFRRSLPESLLASLADLVRAMNCYYSNLIEGHDTHPVDIEKALKNDYSTDAQKRDLQLEAKAHIEVQKWIDEGGLRGRVLTSEGVREIHRRFGTLLPDDLLWVEDPATKERTRVVPGEFRVRDVKVGTHVAISPGAIPRFLQRFEEVYSRVSKADSIVGAAARASSPDMDSSFSRWQRPRRPADVARNVLGDSRYGSGLVGCAWPGKECGSLQAALGGKRCSSEK